jgi:S-adenosylmethionine synthetase
MRNNYLFTSESVTEGHPDKIADQISDGILDAMIAQDKYSRVACETILTTGIAFVAGEISTKAYVEIPDIIRDVIKDVGYCDASWGFDCNTCSVLTSIHQQSGDIAMGVDSGGAGDQGLMFGYATNETAELMPMPIVLAHRLTRRLAEVRKKGILPWVRPDGKSQVTVEYRNGKPIRIDTIVVSSQHSPDITSKQIERSIMEKVIKPVMPKGLYDPTSVKHHINPTGRFVVGGPMGDTGLTGRKIIVDTYGGHGSHGHHRTVLRRTWPVTLRKTSWPPAWRTSVKYNWPTQLGWPIRSPSSWTPRIRRKSRSTTWINWCASTSR